MKPKPKLHMSLALSRILTQGLLVATGNANRKVRREILRSNEIKENPYVETT